jgi:hypothetical protein
MAEQALESMTGSDGHVLKRLAVSWIAHSASKASNYAGVSCSPVHFQLPTHLATACWPNDQLGILAHVLLVLNSLWDAVVALGAAGALVGAGSQMQQQLLLLLLLCACLAFHWAATAAVCLPRLRLARVICLGPVTKAKSGSSTER